jgi:hypothetical protein
MPAARIPSTTHTQVGVELDELELVVVGVVGASVVVCSTVVATVVGGAVVVSSTVVVTGSVSVVVTSATPVAVSPPARSKPAANSATKPTSFAIPLLNRPLGSRSSSNPDEERS